MKDSIYTTEGPAIINKTPRMRQTESLKLEEGLKTLYADDELDKYATEFLKLEYAIYQTVLNIPGAENISPDGRKKIFSFVHQLFSKYRELRLIENHLKTRILKTNDVENLLQIKLINIQEEIESFCKSIFPQDHGVHDFSQDDLNWIFSYDIPVKDIHGISYGVDYMQDIQPRELAHGPKDIEEKKILARRFYFVTGLNPNIDDSMEPINKINSELGIIESKLNKIDSQL